LSESLWSPSKQEFDGGLNSSLAYEVYAGRADENQLYWVASKTSGSHQWRRQCTAMDSHGRCHTLNCNARLPALCTQTAPASNSGQEDTSAPFRIAQAVGKQVLVGYRDFYTFHFSGVRFANEPERFAYSTPLLDATGTNSALSTAPECLQAEGGSTDCLFLNLWTSSLPGSEQHMKSALKPVMVR
jgi:hypothetical protein